ncbi:MAG: hypothetical protein IKG87_14810 [Clostridia bacterium]|nr:hypothetical protein [Clostridia bacterium]
MFTVIAYLFVMGLEYSANGESLLYKVLFGFGVFVVVLAFLSLFIRVDSKSKSKPMTREEIRRLQEQGERGLWIDRSNG